MSKDTKAQDVKTRDAKELNAKELGKKICLHHTHMHAQEIIDLMEQGADVNIDVTTYPISIMAVRANNLRLLNILIRYPQVNINAQDTHGMTALVHAIYTPGVKEDLVDLLLSCDALDLNLKTVLDQTAVILAVKLDKEALAKKLIMDPRTDLKTHDGKGISLFDYIEKHDRLPENPLMPTYQKALKMQYHLRIKDVHKTKKEIPVKRLRLKKKPPTP